MLGVKNYTKEYVDDCRARIDGDIAAYRSLAGKAPQALESAFFGNLVLLLDYLFVHRLRTVEGKDGNALNEVRILSNSMLNNHNVLTTENIGGMTAFSGLGAIKLLPGKSVLGYQPGDAIVINEESFVRIADAFFAELERRFL